MFHCIKQLCVAVAACVLLAAPAQANLVGRDINGYAVDGSSSAAVFLYDTDLNVTWLRNANAGAGSIYDNGASANDGRMSWANAVSWVNDLTVGTFGGWRLPTGTGTDKCKTPSYSGTVCGYNVDTATGELAHLYYDELGNLSRYDTSGNKRAGSSGVDWGLINVGDFLNMKADLYWYGVVYQNPWSAGAWEIDFGQGSDGLTGVADVLNTFSVMAVRPGDVLVTQVLAAQVPEPESVLLTLSALGALVLVRRRRAVGA